MPSRVTYIFANVDRAVAFGLVADLLDPDRSQAGRKDVESRFRAEGMVEALSAIYGES